MWFLRQHLVDPLGVDFWVEVALAILCGGALGLERQLRGKPCGIRTSVLICLGTILFLRLAEDLNGASGADPTRVLGQLVGGIGFLGGGAIMARGGTVTGMTSAATIWVLAAVSAAIASGFHVMAVVVTAITLVVLVGTEKAEAVLKRLGLGIHKVTPSPKTPSADE